MYDKYRIFLILFYNLFVHVFMGISWKIAIYDIHMKCMWFALCRSRDPLQVTLHQYYCPKSN